MIWTGQVHLILLCWCALSILYYLVVANYSAAFGMLQELPATIRAQPAVAFALRVRSAITESNYHAFFKCYRNVPFKTDGGGGLALMKPLAMSMRLKSLTIISKSYKPGKVPVSFIEQELAFDNSKECVRYIESCGGVCSPDKALFLTESSNISKPEASTDEREALIEQDNKAGVTHGAFYAY